MLFLPILATAQTDEDAADTYRQIRENLYKLKAELQGEIEIRNPNDPAFTGPNDKESFAEVYKRVFSTVVLGKTDAIANGSAFSYTQDNTKNTFSVNGTRVLGSNILFDGGLSLKSKDHSYSYYKDGKWSSDITIKAGVAIRISGKKAFYSPEGAAEANKARSEFFTKEYEKYLQLLDDYPGITLDASQLNALKAELNDVPALVKKIKEKYGKSEHAAKAYHGYRIFWANINGSYTNSSFSVLNDSVVNENIQEKFSSVSKFTAEVSINFHQKGIKHFYIAQVYGRFNRVGILDNVELIDKKIKASPIPSDGQYSLYYYDSKAGEAKHFGTYAQIHAPVLMVDYGAYLAYLHPFNQQLGINARVNFSTPYGDNEYNFSRYYSALIGPIIRLDKDKLFSTATFTINVGFENVLYNENAWDKFVIKASAAIPFNVFEKSK